MKTYSDEEIAALLQQQPAWLMAGGKLVRDWEFRDFAEAMVFVNSIASLAEAANHHPDIDIRYNRVCLGLISHDAGGITRRDAAMVRQIDAQYPGPEK